MQPEIVEVLKRIIHPEYDKDLVELGILQETKFDDNKLEVFLLFKRKNDPLTNSIVKACDQVLKETFPKHEILIHVIEKMKEQSTQEKTNNLAGVKNIIVVASGKGGVGKSTVASNIAVGLALEGNKVGLLDADIFGPSVPKLFRTDNEHPGTTVIDGKEYIEPIERFGVKLLSIGYLVNSESALIWRGPMASSALKQLLNQGNWGELDYLVIDTPPGTSDIHLTLLQTIKISGVVIVTTPQEMALIDVVRAIEMFTHKDFNIPILGIVENMAWFTPEELPDNKYFIFGKFGGQRISEKYNLPLLAQIPLVQSICENADIGNPIVLNQSSRDGLAFTELAKQINRIINKN